MKYPYIIDKEHWPINLASKRREEIKALVVGEAYENLLQQFSSDGFNQTYKYTKMNRMAYGLFPIYSEFPDSYEIEFISSTDSLVHSTKVPARSHRKIAERSVSTARRASRPIRSTPIRPDGLASCWPDRATPSYMGAGPRGR